MRRASRPLLAAAVLLGLTGMADGYRSCAGWTVSAATTAVPPCPERPNCVAGSLATAAGPTLAEVAAAALAEPRSRIELRGERVLVVTFRSRLFEFIDEAVFVRHDDGTIEYRCGACSGYYDFGVNSRRMARITARLGARGKAAGQPQ